MQAAAPHRLCLPTPKANTLASVPVLEDPVPLTPSGLGPAIFLSGLPLGHLLGPPCPHMGAPLGPGKSKRKSLSIPSDLREDLHSMQAALAEVAGERSGPLQGTCDAKKPAWTTAKRTKVLLIGVHVGK